jgi:N6-adenosine-specific RNA methylase IME4
MNVDICSTQKKYSIIYADPPWEFSRWSNKAQRHVTGHYSTMTIQEIMDLPVKEIAADNAVLLMWATFPNLPLALKAIEAWGFTYKTCAFTWVKQNKKSESLFWGMGYYTRSNAEICLLATRGKPLPRLSHKVHSVIVSPVERHSKKPASTRERIVELFGNIPRIELFAREQIEGWDCWGNEVPPKKRKGEPRMKRETYYRGVPGKKFGIWNDVANKFQFGICEDTPMLAEARLYQRIGDNARKWRFQPKMLPDAEVARLKEDSLTMTRRE